MIKILTNTQYKKLVERAGSEDSAEVTLLRKELESQKEIYESKIRKMMKDADNKEIDDEILKNRQVLLTRNEVLGATQALTEEKNALEMKLNNKTKEVEIMTKAFENLGFDVKDMKDILDQLVKGIISKNTIQVIK